MQHCVTSVLEIRQHLTTLMDRLEAKSKLRKTFQALRGSCRKFLDSISKTTSYEDFLMRLGEMRGIFGLHLATLAAKYELEVEPELASMFPGKAE